ncbi:type IV toxin-antitoxin system AbiEi family antitoxin domain-containing protein [Candidatus Protochlamydia phocaeensis]|uniref:type IV toxin-antitoxin system AbiEi family antitoxin domain-containing protein n=1 Tax=Candidatus Protochlamydia phocaeensis TaxID=1414722 RepID=UPI0008393B98|nr:type IV toxin-antitoxin system AbiEi family antitoxin domain-containing protein [Candidatus Protochlamydia phocaeensis]
MKKSNCLYAIQTLLKQPSFTANEAKIFGVFPAHLAYYIKKGQVRRLGRGIYQGTNFKYPIDYFQWEDLIEAVNSVPGGVVCLISALALYDITEQIARQFWIAVPHGTSIKERKLTKIIRFRNMELGKTTLDLGGIQIPIFDRERTVIDSFRLLSRETAIKALKVALAKKGKERLDLKKLQVYAKKLRYNIQPYLMTATT